MANYQHLAHLLSQIVQEMKRLGQWQQQGPSQQALASQEPFCCDTLSFTQWLQFVYLPRFTVIVEQQLPLPAQMSVSPMAEEALMHLKEQASQLVNLIADVDEFVTGQRQQSRFIR